MANCMSSWECYFGVYFPRFEAMRKINTNMMTSSNGNIFRVTGTLCGKFTGPGEIPAQRPVTRNFDVFFDLRLNKRLSTQPWGWWFETPPWSLWCHCNETNTPEGTQTVRHNNAYISISYATCWAHTWRIKYDLHISTPHLLIMFTSCWWRHNQITHPELHTASLHDMYSLSNYFILRNNLYQVLCTITFHRPTIDTFWYNVLRGSVIVTLSREKWYQTR